MAASPAPTAIPTQVMPRYFALSLLLVLCNLWPLLSWNNLGWYARSFQGMVLLTYGVIYLLPVIALSYLLLRWIRLPERLYGLIAVLGVGVVQTYLFADRTVYGMFDFHINGFVWNLVTTRGGLASMGASSESTLTFASIVAGLFVLQACLWWVSRRSAS